MQAICNRNPLLDIIKFGSARRVEELLSNLDIGTRLNYCFTFNRSLLPVPVSVLNVVRFKTESCNVNGNYSSTRRNLAFQRRVSHFTELTRRYNLN
jgi:hypothetical protein